MTDWRPFQYRDFYDVPRLIVVSLGDRGSILLDSPFDDAKYEYADVYTVSLLPAGVDLGASWSELPRAAVRVLGTVPVHLVLLDPSRRSEIDLHSAVLRSLVAEPKMEFFHDCVRRALAATPVARLLSTRPAVVLDRVAFGAGATDWYLCRDEESLHQIAPRLGPGSVVSFYFDERLRAMDTVDAARSAGREVLAAAGEEIVIGALADDGLTIERDFPSSAAEVDEFLSEHASARRFFVGEFPGRDNDGVDAVTLTIPDLDGVVRPHPH